MAEILSTSYINSLVSSYETQQREKVVAPLQTRKSAYEKRSSSYTTLSSKLGSLKTLLTNLKLTDSDSVFRTKSTTTSNASFVTSTATSAASKSSYSIFVNQLAKSDLAVSQELISSTANAITGTHSFRIKTGDGSGGEYISNVDVTFGESETNQTVMEKIRDAINSDKAVVTSGAKTAASSYSEGTSTFKININGTEQELTVNGGGTYEELIDEMILTIGGNVSGVIAEKVVDSPNPGDVKLKLTVENSTDYISISHVSGFDLTTDLGISVTNEKGASGIVSASAFTPESGYSQFSLTSKNTGLDFRITSLSDTSGSALSALGLNFGSSRQAFVQSTGADTPGFVYSDISSANNLLNSRIKFNSIDIQKNSNNVDDLVSGITFNLHSVMQSTDNNVNIGVDVNTADVKGKVEDFVKKFNDIYQYIRNNSTSISGTRGVFMGDSSASSILSSLQSVAYSQVSGLPTNAVSFLSQIGISFDYQSGLKVADSTLLESKITDNLDQVEAMFNSTSGIANTLFNKIEPYLGSSGYLTSAQTSNTSSATYLSDRIKSAEARITKSSSLLRSKYQQMQVQLATLLSNQSYFSTDSSY